MGLISAIVQKQRRWRDARRYGLAKLYWITFLRNRQDEFRRILADEAHQAAFDGEYLKALTHAQSENDKTAHRLWVFQMVLVGFLALSAIPIQTEITVFGLSARSTDKLKEVVLVVSAVCAAFSALHVPSALELRAALSAFLEQRLGSDASVQAKELLSLPYLQHLGAGLRALPVSPQPDLVMTTGSFVAVLSAMALGFLILLAVALITLAVHAYVIIDIIRTPGLPPLWSWSAIGVTIAADVFSVLMFLLFFAPLPFQDFRPLTELIALEKADPTAHDAKLEQLARAHVRREWFRLFGMRVD